MKIKRLLFDKYPLDIIICLVWSLLLIPLVFLSINNSLRIILGIPFLLFIPGYLFLHIVFPIFRNKMDDISTIERFSLSIVISIVTVATAGIIINFSPWILSTGRVLLVLIIIIFLEGVIGLFTIKEKTNKTYYNLSLNIHFFKSSNNNVEKGLKIVVIILVILTIIVFSYAVMYPKRLENFTEFYILNEDNQISDFPEYIYVDDELTFSVGIINHEFKRMDYTIEFWLIDQEKIESEQSLLSQGDINHMYFLKKESISLDHFSSDNTYQWNSQWENTYSFSFSNRGEYKIMALLQTDDTMDYNTVTDYKAIYNSKIENSYRELHVWVQVI